MTTKVPASISDHFGDLEDPRIDRTKRHELLDILVIAICAVICGADDWVAVESFGKAKEEWLRTFLMLPNGIPSHDTFGRVFARLDPEAFRNCFRSWVAAVFERTEGQVVGLDGKTVRGSHDQALGKGAIHMVSAWATANELVLGQLKVEDKSNEITALPALLRLLNLEGCIVTIDAMGCQTGIAQDILDQDADYVLALKENQGTLYQDVILAFQGAQQGDWRDVAHDYHETFSAGHGRVEVRRYWTLFEPEYVDYFGREGRWPGLASVGMVEAERWEGSEVSRERRYFISSLSGEARTFARAVRGHWGIENGLHWVLDVSFREDNCRVRKGYGAENLTLLRHIAVNLLKQEKGAKLGIKNKRLRAAWDNQYLFTVLTT